MAQQTHNGIQAVKRIITDLRPSILDHLGLMPAIDWLLENFLGQTGFECSLAVPKENFMLETEPSTAIFRIAQEALMNIASHANASRVAVDIEIINNTLLMTIADNGCGMPPAQRNDTKGFGISGMVERARHLGGQLTIDSQLQRGTTIRLNIPFQDIKLRYKQ